MIHFNLQFEKEKVISDVLVLHLGKGDHRGLRGELAKVDWQRHPTKADGGTATAVAEKGKSRPVDKTEREGV